MLFPSAYINIIREDVLKLRFSWDRSFIEPATNPLILSHGMDRLLMPVILLGRYTQLLIFPWRLLPDYSGNAIGSIAHLSDPYLWLGFATIVAWVVLFVTAIRRKAFAMLFCLLALGVTYGLVGNIVSLIGTNLAERLMYLPSAFFLMIVAMGLAKLSTRWLTPTLALLILLGSWRSFTYAQIWNDRLNLYKYAVREQPGAIRMYSWLATEYLNRGQGDRAIATMQQAQQEMPQNAEVWCNSSAIAMRMERFNLADQYLSRAESIQVSMHHLLRQDLSTHKLPRNPLDKNKSTLPTHEQSARKMLSRRLRKISRHLNQTIQHARLQQSRRRTPRKQPSPRLFPRQNPRQIRWCRIQRQSLHAGRPRPTMQRPTRLQFDQPTRQSRTDVATQHESDCIAAPERLL